LQGLFSKRRQFILTDKPRLLYVDPEKMVLKGEIPWTDQHPISCELVKAATFDVLAQLTGRKYHLTSQDADSCSLWMSLINAALEIQKARLKAEENT
jgi:3-phosphoinositide dependent protein kinase-1